MFKQVRQFRKHIGLPINDIPQLLPPDQASFYARFIMEELSEFLKAHEHRNLVDAADALADLLYVTLGAAHHMGLPFDQIFDAVHEANMSKLPGSTKRGGLGQDAMKPEGWVGPEKDIEELLW
jgi:predicted HAD superfamily Cof-like phosphohydrolase